MSNELRTDLVIDLQGNLANKAKQYEGAVRSMSMRSARSMALLQKSTELAGKGLDALSNRYTALATGATMTMATRNVIEMDKSVRSLQIASGKSVDEMKAIQAQLLATAQMGHIRIDYRELESGVAQVVELVGDLDWALANRETMAMTISASGASGEAVGGFMAELQKLGLTADQTQEAIARMLSQGKEGAFTLQNLAALGPRVVSAYAVSGRRGTDMLKEMGAVLQMIRTTSGSSEMAATSFEALMRSFSDNKTIKALQQRGIQVFDPEKLKQGEKILRPINELMTEIVTKTKGDMSKISQVFTDSEASRAFNSFINSFKDTGGFANLEKYLNASADANILMEDSKVMADSYASLLNNLNTAWMEFSTKELGGPIEEIAAGLRSLKQEDVQRWFEMGKALLYVGAAAVAARKTWQAGKAVKGALDWWKQAGQQPAKGPASGGLGGGRMGAVPVYIVDGPMSTLPEQSGQGDQKTPRGKSKQLPTNKSKAMINGAKTGAKGAAAVEILNIASTFFDPEATPDDKSRSLLEGGGGMAGAWAGGAAGAAIGSVVPVIGTAIGAALGSLLGAIGGHWLGGKAADATTSNNTVDLTVTVEGAPGTKAQVTGMRSSSDALTSNVYYGQGVRN